MGNTENYLESISAENYKHQVDIWYKAYNITHEKTELFFDFIISLHDLMGNTYMGADIMELENDQFTHFLWCWDKTIENFNKEKIFFKERGNLQDYFWTFFKEAYYYGKLEEKNDLIKEYFTKLFNFNHQKTRSELDMLTEVYKLFEQNLKK